MKNEYCQLIKNLGGKRVILNESLKKHTTIKIGGPADLFYEARTNKEIVGAVLACRKLDIPYYLLGGGSNLLVADTGFRGLVIKVANNRLQTKESEEGVIIYAEAGLRLGELVSETLKLGLEGLEFAAGIPGTVGGAVRGNAGAWRQSIGDRIIKVEVLNSKGKNQWILKGEGGFSYRQSRFKKTGEVILGVELLLKKGKRETVRERIESNLEKRKKLPWQPSCGCIFINPTKAPAGKLIEDSGLKGKKIGQAQVSTVHANFIVNKGRAKSSQVKKLIELLKNEVKKKEGVKLEEEIAFAGDFDLKIKII